MTILYDSWHNNYFESSIWKSDKKLLILFSFKNNSPINEKIAKFYDGTILNFDKGLLISTKESIEDIIFRFKSLNDYYNKYDYYRKSIMNLHEDENLNYGFTEFSDIKIGDNLVLYSDGIAFYVGNDGKIPVNYNLTIGDRHELRFYLIYNGEEITDSMLKSKFNKWDVEHSVSYISNEKEISLCLDARKYSIQDEAQVKMYFSQLSKVISLYHENVSGSLRKLPPPLKKVNM